jgi:hypothetical protein
LHVAPPNAPGLDGELPRLKWFDAVLHEPLEIRLENRDLTTLKPEIFEASLSTHVTWTEVSETSPGHQTNVSGSNNRYTY